MGLVCLPLHHRAIEIGRNWETRTPDILLPRQTHYQTVQSSVEIVLVLSVIKDRRRCSLSAFRLDDGWEGHLLGHPTDGMFGTRWK